MIILLMGPPACGKGTVGKSLSEKLNIPVVSIGALLRNLPENSVYYQIIQNSMANGELAPNDIAAKVLKQRLGFGDCRSGYILDGWARQMSDLDQFNPNPDFVLFIEISKETAIKRADIRRAIEHRDDDKDAVMLKRFKDYKEKTLEVVNYFDKQGILIRIDGEGTIEEVFERVTSALGI